MVPFMTSENLLEFLLCVYIEIMTTSSLSYDCFKHTDTLRYNLQC
jgi:hypothetical protein